MRVEYRWIEEIREFEEVAEEWDRALYHSGDANPFLLSDFVTIGWRHSHEALGLRILAIYDNNKLIGGLPLHLKEDRAGLGTTRYLVYIGGSAANYTELLWDSHEPHVLPLLLDALASRNDWDGLHLTDIRGESSLLPPGPNTFSDPRFHVHILQDHMNWAVNLAAGKEAYLKTISKKLLRDLRSKRRYVERNYGPLQLKVIRGRDQVERHFDLYRTFSLQAFAARNRKSSFKSQQYAAFFREFLVLMDQSERLAAHALLAGGKVIAISFGYRFGKGFNWVLTAFNYDYKHVRPGYLLIGELIEEMGRRGETYYNWYGHARFYKTQWCNEAKPLYQLFVFNRSVRGVGSYLSKRFLTAVARKVKNLLVASNGRLLQSSWMPIHL